MRREFSHRELLNNILEFVIRADLGKLKVEEMLALSAAGAAGWRDLSPLRLQHLGLDADGHYTIPSEPVGDSENTKREQLQKDAEMQTRKVKDEVEEMSP